LRAAAQRAEEGPGPGGLGGGLGGAGAPRTRWKKGGGEKPLARTRRMRGRLGRPPRPVQVVERQRDQRLTGQCRDQALNSELNAESGTDFWLNSGKALRAGTSSCSGSSSSMRLEPEDEVEEDEGCGWVEGGGERRKGGEGTSLKGTVNPTERS
jgi:hypothetical protein